MSFEDRQGLFKALFKAERDRQTSLFEQTCGQYQIRKFKSCLGNDETRRIEIYTILADIFRWFPQKPQPKDNREEKYPQLKDSEEVKYPQLKDSEEEKYPQLKDSEEED